MDKSLLKYNFVVVQGGSDYNRVATSDLFNRKDVKVFFELCKEKPSKTDKILYTLFKSSKVDKYLRMPFLKRWQKKFENIEFEDSSKPLCFVINAGLTYSRFSYDFLDFLHRKYPQAKFVAFYNDIISSKRAGGRPNALKSYYDLITCYDKDDAEKYGLVYYPTFFSDCAVQENPNIEYSDVYFVGAAKNRLSKILEAYKICNDAGLKCDFYIKDVPLQKRLMLPGIHYLENNMPYIENLEHVVKSRCLLEIMQKGAVGATFRLWEAINYGKALITDNKSIQESAFYDAKYVTVIDCLGRIDLSFIKNFKTFENPLKDKIRPKHFLKFIQEKLESM